MYLSSSSVKILKPDVPPKRHNAYMQLLSAWLRLRFLPAWHLVAVRDTVAEQSAAAEWKILWRHRA